MTDSPDEGARRQALVAMAINVAIGSSSFTLIKRALRELSPVALAAGRVVFSAAAFLVVVLLQPRRRSRIASGDRVRVILCGLGGSAGFHLLFSWGQGHTSVVVSAIVLSTMPVMVALGERVFLHHRLTSPQIIGLGLALIGVAIVAAQSSGGESSLLGIAAVGGATFAWAGVTVGTRSLAGRYDPWWLNTPGTVLGALVMLGFAIPRRSEFSGLGVGSWVQLLWLGAIASAVIYASMALAMRVLSATEASSLSTLVTPVSVVVAWIVIGERPGPWDVVGGVITVGGVMLVNRAGVVSSPRRSRG